MILSLKLRNLFIRNKIFIGRTVSSNELRSFFDLINPITSSRNLIRVGSPSDGGYLIPDDLDGVEICFSPGVSLTSDFELEMANRGIKCFMADYSVEAPQIKHKLFSFEKKFIGSVNNDVFMTLENWVSRNTQQHSDMILQMDIEGAEYETILSTPKEVLRRFRTIVIEFHDLEQLVSKLGYILIYQTFRKILEDFEIVHIHPNNIMKEKRAIVYDYEIPSVIEITFHRKDRITEKSANRQFPHPLDQPNSLDFEDYFLPRCWFDKRGA